jgi:predicted membrane channel-forming protein YqfA (hemolysin III family)
MMDTEENKNRWEGAGGTPGGVGQFLLGLGMAVAGAYMLTSSVTVSSGSWSVWGYNAFGLSLVPFIFSIGLLFFNGRSKVGWLLLFASIVIIFTGIIMNLHIYFQPTSLFNTLVMLALLAGGVGLVARALRTH